MKHLPTNKILWLFSSPAITSKADTAGTSDFTLVNMPLTLTFAADGANAATAQPQTQQFPVTIVDDFIRENDEIFNLCVAEINSVTVTPPVNVPITIMDNDGMYFMNAFIFLLSVS